VATIITHTIKPAGGGDYTTLQAWYLAQKRDLVTPDEIAKAECYKGGNCSNGVRLDVTTGPTSPTQFNHIVAAESDRYVGVGEVDMTNYAYMENDHTASGCFYTTRNLTIEGMQVLFNYTADGTEAAPRVLLQSAQGDTDQELTFKRCLFWRKHNRVVANQDGIAFFQYANDTSKTTYWRMHNCIVFIEQDTTNFGSSFYHYGNTTQDPVGEFYNNTIHCVAAGSVGSIAPLLYCRSGYELIENNNYLYYEVAANGALYLDAPDGILTLGDNTASNRTEVNTASLRSIPFSTTHFTNVTPGSYDLRPVDPGSALLDAGADLSATIASEDIAGNDRPGGFVWDIGALETDQPISLDFDGTGTLGVYGGVLAEGCYNFGDGTLDSPDFLANLSQFLFGTVPKVGQSFMGPGGNVIGLSVWISADNNPPADNITASIYAHTGTFGSTSLPTGSSLADSLNSFDPSTDLGNWNFGTGSVYTRCDFVFDGALHLDYGTPYCFVINAPNGTFAHWPRVFYTDLDAHPGNPFIQQAGVWTVQTAAGTTYDVMFALFTDNAVVPYEPEVVIKDTDKMKALGYLEGEDVSIEGIWNKALTSLGAPTVTSISDGSEEANLINEIWEDFFEEFLLDHAWNGAKTTATLTQLVDSVGDAVTPPTRWQYAFAMPSDYLTGGALTVNGLAMQPQTTVIAEVEAVSVDGVKTLALLTNQSTAELEYIFDIGSQVSLLSSKVRAACAALLAALIAPQFGKDEAEIEGYRRRADLKLADARAADGQEGTTRFFAESPLLDARRRYRGGR